MSELTREQLAELRENFTFNDTNGDGVLDFEEFARMMATLSGLEQEMPRAEARIGFDEIDTDRDGVIGFEEFVAWWTSD
jgi:Ca2+-binding EF-hand superfamily protein